MAKNNSCIVHPKTKSGQPSKLFSDLREEFDYEKSWEIWNAAVSPEYKSQFEITTKYDELGEPVIDDVLSNLNITPDNTDNIKKYEKQLNTNLPEENLKLIQRVVDFNKKHKAVKAEIESFNLQNEANNTAKIIVKPYSTETGNKARALENNYAIYDKISSYLNNIGYSIDFFGGEFFNGEKALMDPQSGITTATGLINVIKLSNNQDALNELSEEFGHFLVECSGDSPAVRRALNILSNNPEVVEEILGNDYEEILNYYIGRKNYADLMLREALGRFLIKYVNKNITSITNAQNRLTIASLLSKIKNVWLNIKNKFRLDTKTKQEAYSALEKTLSPILHTFSVDERRKAEIKERFHEYGNKMAHIKSMEQSYEDLFNNDGAIQQIRSTIAREAAYYNKTYKDITSLREELDVTEAAAKLFIQQREQSLKNEPKIFKTSEVVPNLEKMGKSQEEILDIRNLHQFGNYVKKIQELIDSQLQRLIKAQVLSSSYEDVLKKSSEINTIASFVETQEPILNDLSNFAKAILISEDDDIDSYMKTIANALSKIVSSATEMLANLKGELYSTRYMIANEFWKNSVDQETLNNIIPEHIKQKENLTDNAKIVEHILTFSMGDISGLSRLFTAYYAQKDPLINIVNNTLRKQEEEARIASQLFVKEIAEITQEYIDETGSNDTSFIFENDEKGKPTHFLKTVEGVSIPKWRAIKKEVWKQINEDSSLTKKQKHEKWVAFVNNSTQNKEITDYDYDSATNSFIEKSTKVTVKVPTTNIHLEPRAKEWITNDFAKLNDAQKRFLIKYLEAKNKLESMLPSTVRLKREGLYYRAVQRVVASAGEAILNNKNGFFEQIGGLMKNSLYALDEDDVINTDDIEDEFDFDNPLIEDRPTNIGEESFLKAITRKSKQFKNKLLNAIHRWLYPDADPVSDTPDPNDPKGSSRIITRKTSSEFNERRKVPIYFTRLLSPERLSNLSTDAAGSLIEYTMACFRFKAMNDVADIMECTYELAKYRRLQKTKYGFKDILHMIDPNNPETSLNQATTNDAASSNMLQSLRQLLDTKLYSEYNMDARGEAGSFSPEKTTQTIQKLTAFSMLGYNIFSGINNIVVGKYQTMIEAIGKGNFDKSDWAWAEKEYHKLLPEYVKELGKPYKTSKLALLDELFNATMEWKETLEGAKYYSNDALRTLSKFNSGMLMNIGETNLKLVALLAKLHNYKMRDPGGNETNLYESLQFDYKYNKNGDKISGKISIKNGYTKPDGTKFTMTRKNGYQQSDLYDFCLKMNVMNHRMHGIYNREDQIEALRHWWGKLLLLFRRFIVPTVENRYMGSRYNVDTKQWEEGFYVTGLKAITKIIMNEAGLAFGQGRIKGALNDFNDFQKANLKKFIGEFVTLIALMFLIALLPDYKDDDKMYTRAINYHTRRLIQEIEFYQPWNINSIYDILQSPSATLGLLTRYFKVIGSIPNLTERYQAGENKGKLKIGVKAMNALPIYPQIRDVIKFAHDDSRFKIFEPMFFESWKDED